MSQRSPRRSDGEEYVLSREQVARFAAHLLAGKSTRDAARATGIRPGGCAGWIARGRHRMLSDVDAAMLSVDHALREAMPSENVAVRTLPNGDRSVTAYRLLSPPVAVLSIRVSPECTVRGTDRPADTEPLVNLLLRYLHPEAARLREA